MSALRRLLTGEERVVTPIFQLVPDNRQDEYILPGPIPEEELRANPPAPRLCFLQLVNAPTTTILFLQETGNAFTGPANLNNPSFRAANQNNMPFQGGHFQNLNNRVIQNLNNMPFQGAQVQNLNYPIVQNLNNRKFQGPALQKKKPKRLAKRLDNNYLPLWPIITDGFGLDRFNRRVPTTFTSWHRPGIIFKSAKRFNRPAKAYRIIHRF